MSWVKGDYSVEEDGWRNWGRVWRSIQDDLSIWVVSGGKQGKMGVDKAPTFRKDLRFPDALVWVTCHGPGLEPRATQSTRNDRGNQRRNAPISWEGALSWTLTNNTFSWPWNFRRSLKKQSRNAIHRGLLASPTTTRILYNAGKF